MCPTYFIGRTMRYPTSNLKITDQIWSLECMGNASWPLAHLFCISYTNFKLIDQIWSVECMENAPWPLAHLFCILNIHVYTPQQGNFHYSQRIIELASYILNLGARSMPLKFCKEHWQTPPRPLRPQTEGLRAH